MHADLEQLGASLRPVKTARHRSRIRLRSIRHRCRICLHAIFSIRTIKSCVENKPYPLTSGHTSRSPPFAPIGWRGSSARCTHILHVQEGAAKTPNPLCNPHHLTLLRR
ncbi:hypothetical protein CONPUDRAFT_138158 [Coniophora puteana RWD-64-598 SS2]|uniref:Uncharacterized protein n=1 Tax=Coniophora puteana (strain RWD-64-598) TaxID=741705 RepID=A0A5M3MHX9_CONPW|nr:uncharacterized protein CONPUDRAFT_138158 [Coniophora puteana RWD-64-598 SS2]EIW78812.1 hypothetical protein CONPUDRAFT_138158 [Coniophora puteana RWD-64-598 SS2]